MTELLEKKFMLPAAVILIGAGMVPFGLLEGDKWAMMSTTLVTGFYALKGWDASQSTQQLNTLEKAKLEVRNG